MVVAHRQVPTGRVAALERHNRIALRVAGTLEAARRVAGTPEDKRRTAGTPEDKRRTAGTPEDKRRVAENRIEQGCPMPRPAPSPMPAAICAPTTPACAPSPP